MPIRHTPKHSYFPLTALIFSALAALGCTISLGGPTIPQDSTAPSPEALEAFNDKWLDLPESLTNGQFTLTFTEEEVASVIDSALTNVDDTTQTAIPLHDTRVALDSDIVLYAQTTGGLFRASGLLTLHPTVDSEGQLATQIEAAEFGRASLDEPMLERIAEAVADSLTRPADSLPISVVLTSVSIVDDQLTVNGNIIE